MPFPVAPVDAEQTKGLAHPPALLAVGRAAAHHGSDLKIVDYADFFDQPPAVRSRQTKMALVVLHRLSPALVLAAQESA